MQTLTSPHIWLDGRGTAWVDDTNTKVREIALDVIAHRWSPKEIHLQHPHLSLAQIYAALGFYYDHKPELDAEIETALRGAEDLRTQMGESPIRQRLGALRRPAWASHSAWMCICVSGHKRTPGARGGRPDRAMG